MDLPPETTPRLHTRTTSVILAASIAVALIVMWSSIAYFIISMKTARVVEEQRVLLRVAHSVREQVHSLFSLLDYFLVSADLWCQEHPNADPRNDPDFRKLADTFISKTHGLIDVRFTSESGGLFYLRKPSNTPLAQVADRDYFQAQRNPETRGLFIAKPVLSRVTGLWGLPISYPLRSKPHGISVIFAAIENRVLTQPFDAARTHPQGSVLLAHRDGTVLFRSPDDYSRQQTMANSWLWTHGQLKAPEGLYQVESGAIDGQPRIGAYVAVPDYPLVVVTTSATNDVLAEWRTKSLYVLLFGAVMTVFAAMLLRRLIGSMRSLAIAGQLLEEQANLDYLTSIPNRRFFMQQGTQELVRAQRYQRPLSLLVFDIDHFKSVNDRYGHEAGDHVLKAVAGAIQEMLRETDTQCRLGGEEFCVLLPETNCAEAIEVAERMREHVENLVIEQHENEHVSVTISVGIAELADQDKSLSALLARADRALYLSKRSGRNCSNFDEATPTYLEKAGAPSSAP